MPLTPEQQARETIDALLVECGWVLQDYGAMNILAAPGVAVREFKLRPGHGKVDYLLLQELEEWFYAHRDALPASQQ